MSQVRRWLSVFCLPMALWMCALTFVAPLAAVAADKVKVQMGTPVDLVFDTAVTGDAAAAGSAVNLHVATAVVVDGVTVIKAGAPATGEITIAKKAGMVGMPGEVAVTIHSVTAVDGTVIALNGAKTVEGKSNVVPSIVITVVCCILGLLMKGQKAEIPAGSTLRATVASMVEVAGQ